jgi:hypothetical protein
MLWNFLKNKKFICPKCRKKTFCRLIDLEGELLPDEFGRCDREIKCKHANYPDYQWFKLNRPHILKSKNAIKMEANSNKKMVFFDLNTYEKFTALERFYDCDFVQFLKKIYDKKQIAEAIKKYRLGAVVNGKFKGAICFPYFNFEENLNAVQVVMYNRETGKRIKEPGNQNFLDNLLMEHYRNDAPEWLKKYKENETKINCFFGEHLIKKGDKFAIVEAPKTAVIASMEYPEFTWLASFNMSAMNSRKLEVFKKLGIDKIYLFPDCGGEIAWRRNVEYFSLNYPISFEFPQKWKKDLTPEQIADGGDLADAIINKKSTEKKEPQKLMQEVAIETEQQKQQLLKRDEVSYLKWWNEKVMICEEFLANLNDDYEFYLPTGKVNSVKQLFESHLMIVNANKGVKVFQIYLDRMLTIIETVESWQNKKCN